MSRDTKNSARQINKIGRKLWPPWVGKRWHLFQVCKMSSPVENTENKWAFYKWIHEYVGGKAQKTKPQDHCLKPAQTLSIHPHPSTCRRKKKKHKKGDHKHETGIPT